MKRTLNRFVMGDIHGSFKPIREFCHRNPSLAQNSKEDNIMFLLGDSGLNYFLNERDDTFKEKLGRYPLTYFIIRGNHDERPENCMLKNPDEWTTETFFGNAVLVEKKYPYIKYAMDGVSIYKVPYVKVPYWERDDNDETGDIEWEDLIEELTLLVIPGAYSVDKYFRLSQNWSWFEDEQLDEVEMQVGLELIEKYKDEIDVVFSHSCPICFEPTDLFLFHVDQSMVDKTMERYMGQIEYNLNYKLWCWGHYHAFRDYPRTDGKAKIMLFNDSAINLTEVFNDITEDINSSVMRY